MTEDLEIRKKAKDCFKKNGIEIFTSVKNIVHKKEKDFVQIKFTSDDKNESFEIKADKLVLAIGVIPNIFGFGLEKTGVELDKNCIKTNEICKTNVENIYAIGDCTYGPWLAHKASKEGIVAANDIAEKLGKIKTKYNSPVNKNNIPGCIYSFPQIASIGITEEEAKKQNLKFKVGKFSGVGNGKSIAANETDNFVKVIFDENTHELLGAHMIGSNVTEMIHIFAIAKSSELLPEDFDLTVFAHPTVSEMIPEAVLDVFGKAIHK